MAASPLIDLLSGRTDVNTYAYSLRTIVYDKTVTNFIRSFDDCGIAVVMYCPSVKKERNELLQALNNYDLFDERAINKLIANYAVELQLETHCPIPYTLNMKNIEGDWYYVRFDDKIVPAGTDIYFNYSGTVYYLGIFIRDRTGLDDIMYDGILHPTNVKRWLDNLLNNNLGIDITLDELVSGAGNRNESIKGIIIPENTTELEIKFENIPRYQLKMGELHALSLLTGRKNYIPFGNALNISRLNSITLGPFAP